MNHRPLSDAELDALSRQVDEQLNELQAHPAGETIMRGSESDGEQVLPSAPRQQALIEQATGEPFDSFWEKFKRNARKDLCLPGGHLHQQWEKWRDLRSKDSVKVAFGVIAGMGIPTASIAPVAVAASVFMLNAIVNIGIAAVCEGCEGSSRPARRPPTAKKRAPGG